MLPSFIEQNFIFSKFNILFVLTGILLTSISVLAARNYIRKKQKWYFCLITAYIISFSILIFTVNWIMFLIAWELVTVTTSLMLIWRSRRIARQYFVIQFIGSSFLFYVILVAINSGYPQLMVINETWLQNLFIFGLGMKSAIFGLHFWLVPVHSIAPSPVSAILSGWVIKLGFITYLKLMPGGNTLLLYTGLLMIFYGGIKALLASDYKVLLAYSSISQLGYIAVGVGGGTALGYTGAIFHIIAHGLAKTMLFCSSGYWIKEFKTRTIYKFKSWRRQQINLYATSTSFLSLMGVPLFLGYSSKFLIKHGFEHRIIFTILLHCAGVLTVMYGLRFFKWGLVGKKKRGVSDSDYRPGKAEKISFLMPAILLIVSGLITQLFPALFGAGVHNFRLINGFVTSAIYFLLAGIILRQKGWFKVKEKKPPSLDRYLRRAYEIFYAISSKSREFDTDLFFESFLYARIYKLSRGLYNLVFTSFQNQLLWIPLFLLLLLLWNSV